MGIKGRLTNNYTGSRLQPVPLGPVYTERQSQLCGDASDTVLFENNGVARKWVATPFWSDSIVSNENSIN